MKLYRARVPAIARAVVDRLVNDGDVDVELEDRAEAAIDLEAIMNSYLTNEQRLNDAVGDSMERRAISYDQRGKVRSEQAEALGHPVGDDVDRYLARQFIENFMISKFVSEVFAEDKTIYRKVLEVLKANDVNEAALRAEAEERIKNINKGSVDYQEALNRALKEVRKRHGLI